MTPGEYNFLTPIEDSPPIAAPRGVFVGLAIAVPLWFGIIKLAIWWCE